MLNKQDIIYSVLINIIEHYVNKMYFPGVVFTQGFEQLATIKICFSLYKQPTKLPLQQNTVGFSSLYCISISLWKESTTS